MEHPIHAKVAGHAFSQITGIDLALHGLDDTRRPHPNNDGDHDGKIPVFTEYENLPIPHVEKVSQHWQQIHHKFNAGYRYFLGRPIEAIILKQTLIQDSFNLLNIILMYLPSKLKIPVNP
ncbi:MAG: hypothetical protein V4732_14865 [Pseudomonadota bacterium]